MKHSQQNSWEEITRSAECIACLKLPIIYLATIRKKKPTYYNLSSDISLHSSHIQVKEYLKQGTK